MRHKEPGSSAQPNFPVLEEAVLARWKRDGIFQLTLKQTQAGPRFVFFEGPPTANGKPGIHHVLARAFKDIICRYKTMQGFFVERKAGWDTHGLPVELEVEKALGLKSKKEIETYGIDKFNKECRKSVWKYKGEWEQLTERIGFWLDLEHPYITYDPSYVESLWWVIKQIWEKDLLHNATRVTPYCWRCGTGLSSHEIAQGYKTIEDKSVFVKFELENEDKSYILVWTTTPWTLPSNVALAVNGDMTYARVTIEGYDNLDDGTYILSKTAFKDKFHPIGKLFHGLQVDKKPKPRIKQIKYLKGSELLGMRYRPLYPDFYKEAVLVYGLAQDSELVKELVPQSINKKSYQNFSVVQAKFVSDSEGTGIVHISPAHGEDDFLLLKDRSLKLFAGSSISEQGVMYGGNPAVGKLFIDADPIIIDDLKQRSLLVGEPVIISHEYPHCWRCDSKLIYLARSSWFILMSKLREKLIENNKAITWVPEHIKEGRFGEWLNEVKDWAFSRERYWGTPLPIWECTSCKERVVAGSLDDLEKYAPKKNKFFLLRHGEAENNIAEVLNSWPEKASWPLSEQGRKDIESVARDLKNSGIERIISSPLMRTRQTAEIVAKELGVPVTVDDRLREIDFGIFDGGKAKDYSAFFHDLEAERFQKPPEGGTESLVDLRRRMIAAVKDLNAANEGATMLIVSHGDSLMLVEEGFRGARNDEVFRAEYHEKAKVRVLELKNLPYDDDGHVDLHRPFIDAVHLQCPKCHHRMDRVKELCDVWFDSGSMPFAQWHYPVENQDRVEKGVSFPADYISEAVDQTRGWFYTLLAVSTLLGKGAPYKNVVCLAHILDAKGQKMSKHVGNVVDPWTVIEQHGADALRFHLFTMNQPGDTKLFAVQGVGEVVRKDFLILWNVVSFWELARGATPTTFDTDSQHVLDRWIRARLDELIIRVTTELDRYQITNAGRDIEEFINDLSTWYIRRSRTRFRAEGSADAVVTLTKCLQTLARLLAPFTPLIADALYERLGGEKPSVHLEPWPKASTVPDDKLLRDMQLTRQVVEGCHALREEAGIRVRQPLGQLVVQGAVFAPEYAAVLQEELNVKEVIPAAHLPAGVDWKTKKLGAISLALDITVTDELLMEGWLREITRNANDLRKQARVAMGDTVTFAYEAEDERVATVFERYADVLARDARADAVRQGIGESPRQEKTFLLGTGKVRLALV